MEQGEPADEELSLVMSEFIGQRGRCASEDLIGVESGSNKTLSGAERGRVMDEKFMAESAGTETVVKKEFEV